MSTWYRALGLLFFVLNYGALSQTPSGDLYRSRVQPLLTRSCLGCHNAKAKLGGLDLSTRDGLLRGSEHGRVVVPGNPHASQLFKVVAHLAAPRMPFKGKKLPDADIATIEEWIKAGVPYEESSAISDGSALSEASKHWAFAKPKRPPLPAVKSTRRQANPIDTFIAVEHERLGLTPLAEADKRVLLRRVYLDLIGVPPAEKNIADFIADQDPQAYEKVVDTLLASPQHGERWGRHWLDIWRYSDWYGWRAQNQVRYSQRHLWRWRDWTVESINSNKPFDRMIMEMIAGDELAPGDPNVVRATGFLGRNWYRFSRNVWLQDTVEYTFAALQGVTIKCARCHSHKYDPIPQEDYYRVRAFFEPYDVRTDRVPGQPDTMKDGLARVYDKDASQPTYRFLRGNESTPDTSVALEPALPQLFGKPNVQIDPVQLPPEAWFPDSQPFVVKDLLAQARAEIERAEAALKTARDKPEPAPLVAAADARLEAARAALPALEARIKADLAGLQNAPDAEQLGEAARKLERAANFRKAEAEFLQAQHELEQAKTNERRRNAVVQRLEAALKALKEPGEGYTHIGPRYPATSSGRRLALASWIASKDNPLTARVAINHVWLRHFGKPLVPTVFNFGRSGKPASHPQLLDWLAVEFMERGWDMKAIHRLIVTSSAYKRQSSGWSPDSPSAKRDPDNTYLWRMNVRRMEAEAVRDSALAIAGKLDQTMGGPEIDETKGHEIFRRSLYFRHAPDLQMDMLKVFDVASPNECFERTGSIVPQQALALANGKLSRTMARVIATDLAASPSGSAGPELFVRKAFERVLGRQPSPAEAKESIQYLREQADLYRDSAKLTSFSSGPEAGVKPAADPDQRARESLVHGLMNHNDFVTIR